MEKINDGGSAFPRTFDGQGNGMTLRDYFAGQALMGFLAAPDCGWVDSELTAKTYIIADAMIKAR